MKIFLDTANIDDIRTASKLGVVDGITTNPSLVAKEGVQYKDRILEIAAVIDGPLSAECVSLEISELCEEARRVASWHPNVVVKIPMGKQHFSKVVFSRAVRGVRSPRGRPHPLSTALSKGC